MLLQGGGAPRRSHRRDDGPRTEGTHASSRHDAAATARNRALHQRFNAIISG
jgi:hypothetical protein